MPDSRVTDRRTELLLLGLLYVAQALPLGFFVIALPAILRDRGFALEKIGLVSALALPFLLKFLWAPLVDRFGAARGHYRSWLLPLQFLSVLTVLAIAALPPEAHFGALLSLGALFMVLAATQDVATDGLAVRLLHSRDRGFGNTLQVGGYYMGQILGGGLTLVLVDRFGWGPALAAMATILALPLPLVARLREPAAVELPRRRTIGMGTIGAFFRREGMAPWIFLLITWRLGETMAQTMINPMLVDRGFSLGHIGLLLGIAGSVGALIGATLAAGLIARLGRQGAMVLTGTAMIMALSAYLWPALGLGGLRLLEIVVVVAGVAAGAATATLYTAAMDASRYESAGSDFTVQQSLAAMGPLLAATLSGFSAAMLGYPGHFALAVLCQLLPVGLLIASTTLRRGVEARALLESRA